MKFILTFLIVLMSYSVDASSSKEYSKTGHDQFSEIVLSNEETFLIKDLEEKYINDELKKLKFKLFGNREKEFITFEDCTYVSNTIFSRSNKTREEYTFTYDTSTVTYKSVSVCVKGTLSTKGVFKGKSKEITVNGEVSGSNTTEEYTRNSENGKFSVVVYPNKRVTLRIVGEAKISNGVMKTYVFGICMKKGAWEVINVLTTCYELIEEDA